MMPDDVGFFCKTFRPDFEHLRVMLESFYRHGPENVHLTLSLPSSDIPAFRNAFGNEPAKVRVVADESYCGHDLSSYRGWHGQQICKLMSWHVVPEQYYVILDSDCYFIRDATMEEFRPSGRKYIAYGSSLRTVMNAGNDNLLRYLDDKLELVPALFPLAPNPIGRPLPEFIHYKDLDPDDPGALERSDIPFKIFGPSKWIFYQPGQIFSRDIVVALCGYFQDHGLTVGDAILICPWEYNWYGEFAASRFFDDTHFKVSAFLHFQNEEDIAFALDTGITEERIATKFPLVAMAARHLSRFKLA
jgi:hypothetical protein